MLAAGYVIGAVVVAAVVHALLRRDGRQRRSSDWAWTVASGVLWPLLVVGAIQAGVIALVVKQLRRRQSRVVTPPALAEDVLLVS
jgi:hypothetical protein